MSMNETGKPCLRRSDRIKKIAIKRTMENESKHICKKRCKLVDILERKIESLEERVKSLEYDVSSDEEYSSEEETQSEMEDEKDQHEYNFKWDILFILVGFGMFVYSFIPYNLNEYDPFSKGYTYYEKYMLKYPYI
jgi:uncharacterized protein YqhQ